MAEYPHSSDRKPKDITPEINPYKNRYPDYTQPKGKPTLKSVSDAAFSVSVGETFDLAHALLLKKHKDYGPKNISQSPGGPMNGLRVRMWDKIARLNNLIDSGSTPEYESIKDTLVDIMNYAAIAILVLENKWPVE